MKIPKSKNFIVGAWITGLILCFVLITIAIILDQKGMKKASSKFAWSATCVTILFVGPSLISGRRRS